MAQSELSPMMKQYQAIKEQNRDCLLFYRLGDFYEMFFEDAKIASKELELVLTGRDCGLEERAPMCGVPFHSCEGYISRLVAKGYKVAICEQMEDPATCKGIVPREIIKVITPGTVTDGNMLDESRNNYLCSVYTAPDAVGVSFVDASTGEVQATSLKGEDRENRLISEVGRFVPSEIIMNGATEQFKEFGAFVRNKIGCLAEVKDEDYFDPVSAARRVSEHFARLSVSVPAFEDMEAARVAVGAELRYLSETQKDELGNITGLQLYSDSQYMQLDLSARRNLELTVNLRTREKRGSLLWVLDRTCTSMGRRMIRNWIEQPLLNPAAILRRQNAVAELFDHAALCDEIRDHLDGIYDIERIMTKVVCASVSPKELMTLSYALSFVPALKQTVASCESNLLRELYEEMDELRDVTESIRGALVDEPPAVLRDGGIIRPGYNPELDELLGDRSSSEGILTEIENREREQTGIKNLRVGYNRVFGYYIEVSNSFKNMVPETYIRKQTLTNCERFITQELKELEGRVLGSRQRAIQLEYELFCALRNQIAGEYQRILTTARAVTTLDVLQSLARVARENNYCMPSITTDGVICIKDGRHPVVEQMLDTPFVPNDTMLDQGENRCAVITGPNMAGKSTYMRQTAMITIMAQIGSFVPARSAQIGLVDAVYTRVGASDDLAGGQSTFMVEMAEVAEILKNATRHSLLIFDEIGRGTSTYDGMSIARAVVEFVSDKKKLGAKTLFATHYHELTELEELLEGVKNYNIAAKKRGFNITFLRRIVRGGADDSYGIEVAKLAGVPDSVVNRAKAILESLDRADISFAEADAAAQEREEQISFTDTGAASIVAELQKLDVNTLTPIEAMTTLFELSKQAKILE